MQACTNLDGLWAALNIFGMLAGIALVIWAINRD